MEFFKQIPKSEARKDFLKILNTMADNFLKTILVTDHGKPQAVILSFAEYQILKLQSDMYKKANKKANKKDENFKSAWGGLELLDENIENYSVWDEVKDDWEANWEKEFGSEPVSV